MRHVLRFAVIKSRGNHQLLLRQLGVTLLARENRDAGESRFVRQPVRHPLCDPVVNNPVKRRADLKPPSALVLDSQRRFFEHQTFRRECRENTPPTLILHDFPKVSRRIKRKNRKRKTVLSLRLGVTTSPGTPGTG